MIDSITIEEKIGQLIIGRVMDWDLLVHHAEQGTISGLTWSQRDKPPRDVAEQFNEIQRRARRPLLIGWANLSYRGGSDFRVLSQLMRIGAARSKELAYAVGKAEAIEGRAVGCHLVAVPNLDVNTEPANPIINTRSIGDDPDLVIELGAELARGGIDGGGSTTAMHFPGHGATVDDSHIRIPTVQRTREQLEQVDMRTFAEVARQGNLSTVCTNHCLYPALDDDAKRFATISRKIVTGELRERIGYEGVIFSDSLTMRAIRDPYGIDEGAIMTVAAGHDLILQDYNSNPQITFDALVRAVREGRISEVQIDTSARRVWALKQRLGLLDDRLVDPEQVETVLQCNEHRSLARRLARESVTVVEDRGLPLTGERIGVIANATVDQTAEDMGVQHQSVSDYFVDRVRSHFGNIPCAIVGDDAAPARELAEQCDVIVIGLFTSVRSYAEDAIGLPPVYSELVRDLIGRSRVALINFGNPYLTGDLPPASASLLTYCDAHDSIDAAIDVLGGELKAAGKLPITLSQSYPFGYSLS